MKNFLILFPVFCLLVYTSYELYLDYQKKPETQIQNIQNKLGVVITKENLVKRKSSDAPYWYNLSEEEAVYDKDLIKTGVDSYTQVRLSDQSIIEIGQNSLIVFEKNNNRYKIDFRVGELATKNNSQDLLVKINNTTIEANKADITVRANEKDGTQVEVQKGDIQVTDNNNKTIKIDRNRQLEIDQQGKVKSLETVILLSSPENLSRLKSPQQTLNYPFTWAVLKPEIKKQRFQISTSEDFNKNSTQTKWAHQAVEANVKSGLNYWRVSWQVKDKKTNQLIFKHTKTRKIFLDPDESIHLQQPKEKAHFEFLPGNQSVHFSWKSKVKADLFLLELSNSPDFKTIVGTYKTKEPNYRLDQLDNGGYFWRVRAYNKENSQLGMSAYKSFQVTHILPKLPELIEPISGFTWSIDEALLLKWQEVKEADHYELIISSDSNFSKIRSQQQVKDTQWLWKWQEAGTYYWKVSAWNKEKQRIGQSVSEKFIIKPAVRKDSIQLLRPKNQKLLLREKTKNIAPAVFEWKPAFSLAPNYKWILSKNADLSEPIEVRQVTATRTTYDQLKNGIYFWKVEWYNEKEEMKYTSPIQAFQFQFSTSLPAPELTLPVNKSIFYTSDKTPINFQWEMIEGAKNYRLILETYNQATKEMNLVKEITTEKTSYTYEDLLPGIYHWRVRGLDADFFEGSYSHKRVFKIKKKEALSAPKLRPAVVK